MWEIFNSRTKVMILLYLGLRGGTSGRRLARALEISPSQIFKALTTLEKADIIQRYSNRPVFFYLNPHYLHYDELVSMIHKEAQHHPQTIRRFIPPIPEDRKVDPISVYEIVSLLDRKRHYPKLTEVLT